MLGDVLNTQELLTLATSIEGHPDNVAPALLGGLTSSVYEDGVVYSVKRDVDETLCFAAIVPENACGLRYRHETRGEGNILAQCEDELLVAFPDGDSLMQAGRMLLERSRAEVFQLPDAPAAAQLPDAQAFMPGSVIRHKKYGMGRIVSIDGPFADIRFEGETAARRFHLAQSLRSGFLFSAG